MADINQIITLGIGTPGDIEHFILLGLNGVEAPIPVVTTAPGELVHELRLFTPAGVEFARVSDFDWDSCSIRVNSPGVFQAQLSGAHEALAALEHRGLVELWRKDPERGIGWYRHFSGIYLDQDRALFDFPSAVIRAKGDMAMLERRVVNWPANTSNRSKFIGQPAETIAKLLVQYNCTADATVANGRKRDGTNWPATVVSVEPDEGRGTVLDWYCHGAGLLETLQELALAGGGDFDLVKTGANAWEFRWYEGQLGSDRTSTVKFSVALDNMGDPRYRFNRMKEGTVACVWGQGEDATRDYVTRTGPDYGVENDIEFYVNATDVEFGNTSGLNAAGDKVLQEKRAREEFSFEALQTESTLYQVHYGLGDLVRSVNAFSGQATTQKVTAIHLGFDSDRNETLSPELGTP